MAHPVTISLACLLSMLPGPPPGVQFDNSYLQIFPLMKAKCPLVKANKDVIFRLYTDENPTVYEVLTPGDDAALASSHIDFARRTVIYFHAFFESPDAESGTLIRESYMLRGDTNLIMVDAMRLEAGPWYLTAADNTWYIGHYAAILIDYLVTRGLRLADTHLIGHSLGAQAAGVAGARLRTGRVARITGLDPALPLFGKAPAAARLDAGDAQFVDVIHTDAGLFGIHAPAGHADFYPNGGISPQPGCELEVVLRRNVFFEKCPNESKVITIKGEYLIFALSEKSDLVLDKSDLDNIKESAKAEEKMRKYFRYSKLNADLKSWRKINKEDLKVHAIRKKQIKINDFNQEQQIDQVVDETENTVHITSNNTKDLAESIVNISDNIAKTLNNTEIINNTEEKKTNNLNKLTIENNIKHNYNKSHNNTDKHVQTVNVENQEDVTTKSIDIQDMEISFHRPKPTILKPGSQYKPKIYSRTTRSLFNRNENQNQDDNMLLKILEFLLRHRRQVIPIVTVMREINTLVKGANGELNHSSKERNHFIGTPATNLTPLTVNLALGKDPPAVAFIKRLFKIGTPAEQLTIAGVPGK